ncbi:MAG TPA: Cro/CI family transcriptional regulator [Bryobacteraceae bacterium]|nr:Cro/CI family transcriptional regulator [Bryobacteraceae bacterium]
MAEKDEALKRAIEAAGNSDKLASDLGITPQALSQWERVPHLRVLKVEQLTGVPRHELRPDLYPAPASSEQEAAE